MGSSDWISVKERLPEKDETVFVTALLYEAIASHDGVNWVIDLDDRYIGISSKNITHWMSKEDWEAHRQQLRKPNVAGVFLPIRHYG